MNKTYLIIFTFKGDDFAITDNWGVPIVISDYKKLETLVKDFGDMIDRLGRYNKDFSIEWAASQLVDFNIRATECTIAPEYLFNYLSTYMTYINIAGIPTQGVRVLDRSLFTGNVQKTFEDIGLEAIASM